MYLSQVKEAGEEELDGDSLAELGVGPLGQVLGVAAGRHGGVNVNQVPALVVDGGGDMHEQLIHGNLGLA